MPKVAKRAGLRTNAECWLVFVVRPPANDVRAKAAMMIVVNNFFIFLSLNYYIFLMTAQRYVVCAS